MLGGEPVVRQEHGRLRRSGERAGVRLVTERGAEHVSPAMEVQDRGRGSIGGVGLGGADEQRRNAAGGRRLDARPRRRRELRLDLLVRRTRLVQVVLTRYQPAQRLPLLGDPREQLTTDRHRLGHRLVDVAQQLPGSLEQRLAGDGQLDAVRRAPQQLDA